jgi:thiol-disulfide isomerase/thioredoxin
MYIKVGSDNDALNLSKLLNDGNWMVLYYAEWCGHCKTMKPEWNRVVNKFNNKNTNSNKINVAEIESQHIGKLLNKPEIEGFPTIKMYNNGKPVANFDDERIASKIEEFANNNANKKNMKNNMKQNMKNNIKKSIKESIKESMKEILKEDNHLQSVIHNKNKLNKSKTNKIEIQLNSPHSIKSTRNHKINEINMNNLIAPLQNMMQNKSIEIKKNSHKINTHKINTHNNPQNILNLPCTSIRRAKVCKTNPKCMYDGADLRCKDKLFIPPSTNNIGIFGNTPNKTNSMIGNIIFKNTNKSKKNNKKSKHMNTKHNIINIPL